MMSPWAGFTATGCGAARSEFRARLQPPMRMGSLGMHLLEVLGCWDPHSWLLLLCGCLSQGTITAEPRGVFAAL